MSFEVKGRLFLQIKFAGVEFPFQRVNSVNFLHMSASGKINLPMVHLSLNDPTGFMEKEQLVGDGIPMEVTVSPSPDIQPKVYNFRVNTPKKTHSSPNTVYEFDGYLDVPKYWHDSTRDYTEGLASDVLKSIAGRCGLEFDGESSNDFQVWWPGNRRFFQWACHVAGRSYVADDACMQLGIDFDKKMYFKNVNELSGANHKMSFMEPRQGFILATDVDPLSNAGSNNHVGGYSGVRVYQNMMENVAEFNVPDDALTVSPTSGERSFLRNKVVKGEVEKGSVMFGPLNFGNSHPMYQRALYQNQRFENLFNFGLRVHTPELTKVKLFDNIDITLNYPENNKGPRFSRHLSGIYKVVTKNVYVNGSNYYELFTMMRRAYGDSAKEN